MNKLHSILIIGSVIWIALANGVRIPMPITIAAVSYILIRCLWSLAMLSIRSQARREELRKKRG